MGTQDLLRAYLQFQEQLHNTQLAIIAIEKNRQDAEAAAASNSLVLNERLRVMEKTIANQHLEQLNGLAHLDKTILIVAGAFAFMGFFGVGLLSAFLQWAALNRLAAAAAGSVRRSYPPSPGHGRSTLASGPRLGTIQHPLSGPDGTNGTAPAWTWKPVSQTATRTSSEGGSDQWLRSRITSRGNAAARRAGKNWHDQPAAQQKSKTFLKLDKTEDALRCLDEILVLDPGNADALVKKGAALERLQRINAAIECYDRAIAQDSSMVIAYLCKAGVFNRMERYSEALACYEQALNPGKTARPETLSSNKPRSGVPAA